MLPRHLLVRFTRVPIEIADESHNAGDRSKQRGNESQKAKTIKPKRKTVLLRFG